MISRRHIFQLNKNPIMLFSTGFAIINGIPAIVPAGHTSLQNQVSPMLKSSLISIGSSITSTARTTYFRYLRTLSAFSLTLIFLTGIL